MKALLAFIFLVIATVTAFGDDDIVWDDELFHCKPYEINRDNSGHAADYDVDVFLERDPKIQFTMRVCLTVILKTAAGSCTLRHHQAQSINPLDQPPNLQFTDFYVGESYNLFPKDTRPEPQVPQFRDAKKWFRGGLEIPRIAQWRSECRVLERLAPVRLPAKCPTELTGPDLHAPCGAFTRFSE